MGRGAALLALALSACGTLPNSAIDLYHGLEGGPIADARPPPPGVDSPYPSVATIPARPLAPDLAAQQRIGDRLAAQRDAASLAAAKDPVTMPVPPPLTPPAPGADPNANKVVVDAAPAPPPPPAPRPAAAPTNPSPATPPVSPTIAAIGSVAPVAVPVVSGPLPEFALAPPLPPAGLGLAALPSPAPAVAAPMAAATAAVANTVQVAFTPGSATLPPSANLALRRFAMAHPGVGIAVTGHGGATPQGAEVQSAALDLALRRAAAIATALGSAGVAQRNLRLRADALGIVSTAALN